MFFLSPVGERIEVRGQENTLTLTLSLKGRGYYQLFLV
jgi:hypothetical protein